MPQPVDLPVHCPHCGQAVWLQVEDWMQDGPIREEAWTCPYANCRKENRFGVPGRVVKATADYGRN